MVAGSGSPGLRLTVADADGPPSAAAFLGTGTGGGPALLRRLRFAIRRSPRGIGIRRSTIWPGENPAMPRAAGLGPPRSASAGMSPTSSASPASMPRRPASARTARMTAAGGAARRSSMFMDTWAMPASGR